MDCPDHSVIPYLLAVDLGVKTGLALYGKDGKLLWYRSKNLGSAAVLKKAAHRELQELRSLAHLVLEGGKPLAIPWLREAARKSISTQLICAEDWRASLLLGREQGSGSAAKQAAIALARHVITWSRAKAPTSLTHDAAEAILIGLWGVIELKKEDAAFMSALPQNIKQRIQIPT